MNTEKNPTTGLTLALFWSTVEFLTSTEDEQSDFCVLKGIIPPGISVPLHSHPDTEDFVVLSGEVEVLRQDTHGHEWIKGKTGDYFHVPGGVPHAWRNVSTEPVIQILTTTKNMGRFFQEAGSPITSEPQPVTPEGLARFLAICAKYGYWNATPEENAAIGIQLGL